MEEQLIFKGLASSGGIIPQEAGREERMVCQYTGKTNFHGSIFRGGRPLANSTPALLALIIIIFFVSRTIYFFIKPLGQSPMSAQIIAGILLGPSVLGKNMNYARNLLQPDQRLILTTLAEIGFTFHLFLLGLQTDTSLLKRAGRNAVAVGTAGFTMSYAFGGIAMLTLSNLINLDKNTMKSLHFVVAMTALAPFPVITSLLADLNILNSEIGRLATLAALTSDIWTYFIMVTIAKLADGLKSGDFGMFVSSLWIFVYVCFLVYLARPMVFSIIKKLPEGKPMKESHFVSLAVIVLVCGFLAEIVGQHAALGTFLLGVVIPDGPPLGEALVYKLEAMSTGLFLPLKFAETGLNTHVFNIRPYSGAVIEIIIVCGYIGRFLGTFVSANLYCRVPAVDALCLALVMCCKGTIDVMVYSMWRDDGVIGEEEFALLVLSMLVITGVARPLIGYLYDPSRKYRMHSRHITNLQSHRHNTELRVLMCIHDDDTTVPTFINLLEASHPNKQSPVWAFVLYLVELKGSAASVLVPNFQRGSTTARSKLSQHLVNAFDQYADAWHNEQRLVLRHFTSIAPYASMHDDICMLAVDQNVNLIILPFHKQLTFDGSVGTFSAPIRAVNQRVMEKSPCSVGILVDRTVMSGTWFAHGDLRVILLFLGGPDDREALAYVKRMGKHHRVRLTVVWIRPWAHNKFRNELEDGVDVELMKEFRANSVGRDGVDFKEEVVEDALGTTRVIHHMENMFDLFVVGRYHNPDSKLTAGLNDWSECPELGVVGDTLSSPYFKFSVLVVQQQHQVDDMLIPSFPVKVYV